MLLLGCGDKTPPPAPAPRPAAQAAAPKPEAVEPPPPPLYVYVGDQFKDPFVPMGAALVYQAEVPFDPGRARVTGIIFGTASRTAVLAGHGTGAFFVKGARIFDVMGKTVVGFSASVREDRVIIQAETGEVYELTLRDDQQGGRAS